MAIVIVIIAVLVGFVIPFVITRPVVQRRVRRSLDAKAPTPILAAASTADDPASLKLLVDLAAPADFPLRVRVVKRLIDVVGASLGLILASPLIVGVALAVKLTSKGPVLYRQDRVRRARGNEYIDFTMLKFRSMVQDAEAKTGPVWAGKKDARVTSVGRLIRKTRLDELPQLWNVLRGDMSLVGPRPERKFFVDKLRREIPAYEDRIVALKPGLTGWAQVSREYDSSVEDVRSKLLFDMAYSAHLYKLSSYLRIELRIIFLTVGVVLTGSGAH
jgi:lipopolysaccharide/colanic/teichoic acid biosynthesis glycosyltransferase